MVGIVTCVGSEPLEVLALAPDESRLTVYDQNHFLTYARLIDAERGGVNWHKAASEILFCDVERDPAGSRRCWESHLARARWIVNGSP